MYNPNIVDINMNDPIISAYRSDRLDIDIYNPIINRLNIYIPIMCQYYVCYPILNSYKRS